MDSLSAADARAITIGAQALATPRPASVTPRSVRSLVEKLGVVQIDSVNVLARSHYLPAFSRLGAYDPQHLDRLSAEPRRSVFEYWGHEASLLPVALHPLMRWRMELAGKHAWGHVRRMGKRKAFVSEVLAIVAERGPLGAGEIEAAIVASGRRTKARRAGWWEWSEAKRAIEWLFFSGHVTTASRRGFERLYDLSERVIPPEILATPTPAPAEAHRELIMISARALGVATEADLRDYYRLGPAVARPAIAALAAQGILRAVTVEGWAKPAYLYRDVAAKPSIDPARAALLSPFDSLIWARDRTERVFGMRFRLEIYVPQAKRVHGYYVLPFLLGDRLVARVDLKADRAASALRVQAAHLEPEQVKKRIATALAEELSRMAQWLALDRVDVVPRGELAAALSSESRRRTRPARSPSP